jgi:hypothetical protein
MHALACESVKVSGKGSGEGFTLTRLHFGNSSLMKYYSAEKLNAEGALAEYTVGGLSYERKSVGQNIVERFTLT